MVRGPEDPCRRGVSATILLVGSGVTAIALGLFLFFSI
jgi:hypothetical protein